MTALSSCPFCRKINSALCSMCYIYSIPYLFCWFDLLYPRQLLKTAVITSVLDYDVIECGTASKPLQKVGTRINRSFIIDMPCLEVPFCVPLHIFGLGVCIINHGQSSNLAYKLFLISLLWKPSPAILDTLAC